MEIDITGFTINPYIAAQLMVETGQVLEGKTHDKDDSSFFRWYKNGFQKSISGNFGSSTAWTTILFETFLDRRFRIPKPTPEKKIWEFVGSTRLYSNLNPDQETVIPVPHDVPTDRSFKVKLELVPRQ